MNGITVSIDTKSKRALPSPVQSYDADELIAFYWRHIATKILIKRCCRGAYQIQEWLDNLKLESRGFETSRDFTVICPSS